MGPSPSVPDFVGSASLVAAVWKRKDQTSLFININVLHKCTNNTIRVEGQLTSDCAADFAAGGTDAGAVPHHAVLRPLVGRTHRVRLVVVFVIAGLLPCRMHQRRVSTCGLNVWDKRSNFCAQWQKCQKGSARMLCKKNERNCLLHYKFKSGAPAHLGVLFYIWSLPLRCRYKAVYSRGKPSPIDRLVCKNVRSHRSLQDDGDTHKRAMSPEQIRRMKG